MFRREIQAQNTGFRVIRHTRTVVKAEVWISLRENV